MGRDDVTIFGDVYIHNNSSEVSYRTTYLEAGQDKCIDFYGTFCPGCFGDVTLFDFDYRNVCFLRNQKLKCGGTFRSAGIFVRSGI